MLFALLETPAWTSYVLLGVLIVIFVLGFWWSGRMNKKKQEKEEARLNSVAPGCKVTTIGGISGIVVAVDKEDKSFVLETGDEEHGKSYLKFVREAIYKMDGDNPEGAKETVETEPQTAEEVIAEAEARAEEAIEEKKN
ncbi:MAG: preprotein translocase subunit YajC [Clostridia bacterium]|nr:preprotein translocase subunit YajC [Clostridia bacterium]